MTIGFFLRQLPNPLTAGVAHARMHRVAAAPGQMVPVA